MGLFERFRAFFAGKGAEGGNGATGREADAVSCREALERLFEYLDGELDGLTEEQVARHFQRCERCYPRLRFEEAFQRAIRSVQAGQEPPEALRRKVLGVLESEGPEDF